MVESGMRDLSLEIWMSGFETQLNYKIFEFNLSSQFLKKWWKYHFLVTFNLVYINLVIESVCVTDYRKKENVYVTNQMTQLTHLKLT